MTRKFTLLSISLSFIGQLFLPVGEEGNGVKEGEGRVVIIAHCVFYLTKRTLGSG